MDAEAIRPTWPHEPVMLREVLEGLDPKPGGTWVDGTLGAGGHGQAIANRIAPEGRLIGLDVDPAALEISRERSLEWPCETVLVQSGYEDLEAVLADLNIAKVRGILLDLGVSSMQIDQGDRGFSFRSSGPLDMRMDPGRSPSAADWIASASEKDIRWVLRRYGEENRAQAIARAIVKRRQAEPIETTGDLARIVEGCFPDKRTVGRVHPATRTFQGIRIFINQELDRLERFLKFVPEVLETGGRVAVLAYHSLEDRLVKRAMASWSGSDDPVLSRIPVRGERRGRMKPVTRKALRPSEEEVARNPRSRSARLRVAERTDLESG
jgi:16S rRNA (cytosine1402-N4)-methyltransferase